MNIHRNNKIIFGIMAAVILCFIITSCSHPAPVVYAQQGYVEGGAVQQAPIVVQQPVAMSGGYGGGGDGFFTGLLAGHLMSGGFNRGSHTVEHVYHPTPAAVAPAQRVAPTYRPAPAVTTSPRGIATVNRSTSVSRSISIGRRR